MNSFWENHYKTFAVDEPSRFAQYVVSNYLSGGDVIVELGCGNGRDGLFLAKHVHRYVGVDQSHVAIEQARGNFAQATQENLCFELINDDFVLFDFDSIASHAFESGKRLVVYSRFTLHSITQEQEDRLFAALAAVRGGDMLVLIEARTVLDELYGRGQQIGTHAYVTDHFRRFIDPDVFPERLPARFVVSSLETSRGFAEFGHEDPIVMRAVLNGMDSERPSDV